MIYCWINYHQSNHCLFLSVFVPVCLSLSLYLSWSICLSFYLSVCLSLCICLCICLSFYLSFSLSLSTSWSLSICLSFYLSVSLSVSVSVYLSVSLSVFLSDCLSLCTLLSLYSEALPVESGGDWEAGGSPEHPDGRGHPDRCQYVTTDTVCGRHSAQQYHSKQKVKHLNGVMKYNIIFPEPLALFL